MSSINVFITTGKNPTSAEIVFIRHALSEHNKVNIGVAFSFSGIQYYSNKRMLHSSLCLYMMLQFLVVG